MNGQICDARPRRATGVDVFESSVPWRTFRRRHGQKQYSGTYWSSAMRDRVVSKSRLGLTCLLHADFDQDVTAVFARLGWAREVAVSRGWDFEVWCEPPEAELANLRFLAGCRHDWLFDKDLLAEIWEADLYGPRSARRSASVRPAVLAGGHPAPVISPRPGPGPSSV
ncbi:hypothetical protein ACIA74_40435 [Streptomyces sp. NPDC051658]|uniref:hypothetical protein n=1 Tax=Streptomyces sp. NPDC051658 TaxID=3365667 RepID=UPI0037B4FE44